ncbi:hypothetical protein LR48_Vigan564s002700 [Vigna angularis]|uniref:Uncharacterized protein n=1 Tax=Phaseolus angularis TaxID=3914 RepID=A0A0L9TDX4_PHAAN|nr:uncharacterized protein HKW66_Vig0010630 [Vigna angularis]KOM28717.1 hypothetical protein LR48_Vigan564s002700 [Vigna angularis]
MEDQKNEESARNVLVSSYVTGKRRRSWSREIPRKKRSVMLRKKMILKRFHILLKKMSENEGNPDESSTEEVLLLNDASNFIATNEIGLGGVLLKPSDNVSA